MTRLQNTDPSCNCKKSKRKQTFVSTTKIATRSGGLRRRRSFDKDCSAGYFKTNEKYLKIRTSIYFKKMEASLLLSTNSDSKFRIGKKCDEINDFLSKEIKGIVESNGIDEKSNFDTKNKELFSNKSVPFLNENKNTEDQNGCLNHENEKSSEFDEIKVEEECSCNESGLLDVLLDNKTVKSSVCSNDNTENSNDEYVHTPKKRRTQYKLNFEACAESGIETINKKRDIKIPSHLLDLSYSDYTQQVKLPPSSSCKDTKKPKLPCTAPIYTVKGTIRKKPGRKVRPKGPFIHFLDLYEKNKLLDLTQPSTNELNEREQESQIEVNDQESTNKVDDKSLDHIPDIKNTDKLTIKESETPHLHPAQNKLETTTAKTTNDINLLDNKSQVTSSVSDKFHGSCVDSYQSENDFTNIVKPPELKSENIVDNKNYDGNCDTKTVLGSDGAVLTPLTKVCEDNIINKKRSHKKKDFFDTDPVITMKHTLLSTPVIKQPKVKLKHCSIHKDKSISCVLGFRQDADSKIEALVLYENGTSNWVVQSDLIDDPVLNMFYQNPEHENCVTNRLPFSIHNKNQIHTKYDFKISESDLVRGRKVLFQENCEIHPTEMCDSTLNETVSEEIKCNVQEQKEQNIEKVECDTAKKIIKNDLKPIISKAKILTCSVPKYSPIKFPSTTPTMLNFIENLPECTVTYKTLSSTELNELCDCIMSSSHTKLYPYEINRPIVARSDKEFMHIYLKDISSKAYPERLKNINDGLDLYTCTKLITLLEDCEILDGVKVVVVAGAEDFFAHSKVFEKLLNKSAECELKFIEEDVSMVRYLIQTIRNFSKPIVAVIKHSVGGLAASLLSLFDMVFDERLEQVTTPAITTSEAAQKFLFPRIMGFAEMNEAQIMGTRQKVSDTEELSQNFFLSSNLQTSVRHMRNNGRIQLKATRQRSASIDSVTSTVSSWTTSHVDDEEKLRRLREQCEQEKQTYLQELNTHLKSFQ